MKKTEIPPDCVPPPLATTDEIKEATTKTNEDFIKISLVVRDEEIEAENNIADQTTTTTTKKKLKTVNPTPGIFVNDTFDANEDLNTNIKKIWTIPTY